MDIRNLRIRVLGSGPEADEWANALGSRGSTVSRSLEESAAELTLAQTDLVVALVDQESTIPFVPAGRPQPAPAVALLVGTSHPLTSLMKTLVQAKLEWEATFDAVPDPVAVVDPDGTIRRANQALARALEMPVGETIGRRFSELVGEPLDDDPVDACLADGVPRTSEARYSVLPGTRQVTVSRLPDGSEAGGGIVVVLKDVTAERKQQERLRQAARLADIGQLAAGVAHEINTPLATIGLRAEWLQNAVAQLDLSQHAALRDIPRSVQAIDEQVVRCKRITKALLEFSRARPPEVSAIDINSLCEKAADLLRHQMDLKGVGLDLSLYASLPPILADDGQMRQVLIALLVNALHASRRGGRVHLLTRRDRAGIEVEVTDDGEGIAPEDLDRVFSPFFTTRSAGDGMGLGLAVCRGIVSAHGGTIALRSQQGCGTSVSVSFPVTRAPHSPSALPAAVVPGVRLPVVAGDGLEE